jgi:hypothetical protein
MFRLGCWLLHLLCACLAVYHTLLSAVCIPNDHACRPDALASVGLCGSSHLHTYWDSTSCRCPFILARGAMRLFYSSCRGFRAPGFSCKLHLSTLPHVTCGLRLTFWSASNIARLTLSYIYILNISCLRRVVHVLVSQILTASSLVTEPSRGLRYTQCTDALI